jgi:3D (Asp-Asp-Asp) domain-containing protein
MKLLITTLGFVLALSGHALATQSMLARVTVYWHSGASGQRASSNDATLRSGHCAVDPQRIPYGSKVVFPDATCLAVDSGPAVVSRKAARACARNASERSAIVVDRFFETKEAAMRWANAHPHFMTLQVEPPNDRTKTNAMPIAAADSSARSTITPRPSSAQSLDSNCAIVISTPGTSFLRVARRRS